MVNRVDDFEILTIAIEIDQTLLSHAVGICATEREHALAAVVVYRWFEDDVVGCEGAIRHIRHFLLFESLQFIFVFEPKPIYIFVKISTVQPCEDGLRLFKFRIFSIALDSLHYGVSVVTVDCGITQIAQEVKMAVGRNQSVPHHQINCLGYFMVVNGAEHFKSQIIHHFDSIDHLN